MTIRETILLLATMAKIMGEDAPVRIANPEDPENRSKELIRWRVHPQGVIFYYD